MISAYTRERSKREREKSEARPARSGAEVMVFSALSRGDTEVIVGAMQNVSVVPLLFGLALRKLVVAFS